MINLSILIVHYHVKEKLFDCIKSILDSKPKVSFEILVIDNDERGTVGKELKKKFPKVKYVKSTNNLGYGGGINLGAKQASGEYLFMLNPDTIVFDSTIDVLISFLKKNKKVGIAAPNLYDINENIFPKQGFGLLTPLRAVFALSFLNKIFPNNSLSKAYWRENEDKNKTRFVDIVPGTAFMISKILFEKIGGFDEKFFLFFEEFDLCKRVKNARYLAAMVPKTKVLHFWGESTKQKSEINQIFTASRFYYFKKNFGLMKALFVEPVLRIGKSSLLLLIILIIAAFLRLYHLSKTMPFYGDVGWFYLSARDMILTHHIPLVGITSSHIWIHQGPFWTYILALLLRISSFNPAIGAYFTALLGLGTLILIYKLTSEYFSKRLMLITTFIYATSPIVIQDSRTAYHTSLIPFFTIILIYFVLKWVKGNKFYFPLIVFTLGILYNLEIATFSLMATIFLVLVYGFLKKRDWTLNLFEKKIIFLSIVSFLIPMTPMILYDLHHGFPQTLRFIVWIFYRIAVFLGYHQLHPNSPGETWKTFFPYLVSTGIQPLIFLKGALVSILILVTSIFFNFVYAVFSKKKKLEQQLIFFLFLIPATSYIAEKTNSSAYFLMIYPQAVILIAFCLNYLMNKKKLIFPVLVLLFLICGSNAYFLLKHDYYSGFALPEYTKTAKSIIKISNGRPYNILGKGNGSQYESFTTPYEYLTWYLGHEPSDKKEKLKFYVSQYPDRIKIEVKK